MSKYNVRPIYTSVRDAEGKRRRVRRGMVYALLTGNTLSIGWSLCNTSAGDRYDGEHGLRFARDRAYNPGDKALTVAAVSAPTEQAASKAGIPTSAFATIRDLVQNMRSANKVDIVTLYADGRSRNLVHNSQDPLWPKAAPPLPKV